MAPNSFIFFVTVLSYLGHFSTGFLLVDDCFVSPPCHCVPQGADCVNMGLDLLPLFESVNWKGLILNIQLDKNNISSMDDNAFSNIDVDGATTVNLHLRSNLISSISDHCFDGIADNIKIIDLTDNELTDLPDAFSNLTNLQELYLHKNPLTTLDASTMSELGNSLLTLEIDISHFTSWPTEFFFLGQLINLVLYGIPFDSLHNDAFDGLESTLDSLKIIGSNLKEVPVATCNLTNLNNLLFENNIHLVGSAGYADTCHIGSLNVSSLITISFRNNSLLRFPNVLRAGLSYDRIDLGHNKLQVLQQTSIPRCDITNLNFDHNGFTRIPYAVNYLQYLVKLDLSFNDIVSIEETDLSNLKHLQNLNLGNNKIQYVSNNAFRPNTKLTQLDLSNNDLKIIPEALTVAPALRTIHLDGNSIDCTCVGIHALFWNTSPIMVSGNCKFGTETLQSYLSTVSSRCP